MKYFKTYDVEENKPKFIYEDDYSLLSEYVNENNIMIRTLDVQIVDLADIIAYAAHDLEDGLRQKYFTADEILHDFRNRYGKDNSSYKELERIITKLQKNDYGKVDSSEYSKLFRQELSSELIYTMIHDIGLENVEDDVRKKLERDGIKNCSSQAKL